jgi:hypothetical protein
VSEQNQKHNEQQQTAENRNQPKSETQRRAEEAARRDKPNKGGVSSVGTIGS